MKDFDVVKGYTFSAEDDDEFLYGSFFIMSDSSWPLPLCIQSGSEQDEGEIAIPKEFL